MDEGRKIMKYFVIMFAILVHVKSAVYTNTSEQHVQEGVTVTLIPSINKLNFTSVTWQSKKVVYSINNKLNPNLPDDLLSRIDIVGNHSKHEYNLRISNVSKSDEGNYSCIGEINGTLHIGYVFLSVTDKNSAFSFVTSTSVIIPTDSVEDVTNMSSTKLVKNSICIAEISIKDLAIYISLGIFIFVSCLMFSCFIITRMKYQQLSAHLGHTQNSSNANTIELVEMQDNVHVYHLVDEIQSAAHENVNQHQHNMGQRLSTNRSSSSTNGSVVINTEDEEGYLHPYHSLIPNLQTDYLHQYEIPNCIAGVENTQ